MHNCSSFQTHLQSPRLCDKRKDIAGIRYDNSMGADMRQLQHAIQEVSPTFHADMCTVRQNFLQMAGNTSHLQKLLILLRVSVHISKNLDGYFLPAVAALV